MNGKQFIGRRPRGAIKIILSIRGINVLGVW